MISVPKTPRQAYNPRRKPGTLLQSQLQHLEWAVRPAAERTRERFRFKPAATEAEAAARIEALTLRLRDQMNRPPIAQARTVTPSKRTAKPARRVAAARRRGKAR